VNFTGALQTLGNGASVLLLALPTLVPPEFLPEWISGPVVIFLMTACTGLAAMAALLEPVSALFSTSGKVLVTALQHAGCFAMAAPLMALLNAMRTTVMARFQRIFFTRGKAKMKQMLERQAKRRASVAHAQDALKQKLHEHHPIPGHEENVQIYLAVKLDGNFNKLSADDRLQYSKDLEEDLTMALQNEHVIRVECRQLRGGSIIADCILTLQCHHTDGESAVEEIEDQIVAKSSTLKHGKVSKDVVAVSDPHQIYPHLDLDEEEGKEAESHGTALPEDELAEGSANCNRQAATLQKQAVNVSGSLVFETNSVVRRIIEHPSVLPSVVVTSTKPPLSLISPDSFKGATEQPPPVQMTVLSQKDSPHHTLTITQPCNTSIYSAHEVLITRAAKFLNNQQDYNILIHDGDQSCSNAPAVEQRTLEEPPTPPPRWIRIGMPNEEGGSGGDGSVFCSPASSLRAVLRAKLPIHLQNAVYKC
jgi:hypothetical protein